MVEKENLLLQGSTLSHGTHIPPLKPPHKSIHINTDKIFAVHISHVKALCQHNWMLFPTLSLDEAIHDTVQYCLAFFQSPNHESAEVRERKIG